MRQDTNVVALPAAWRRPPRAGLRHRRLPLAALQPVRLLRGRADPRVTLPRPRQSARPRYQRSPRRLQARGRFGIRLGLGRTRALLRALGRPAAAGPRRPHRRDQRQGQRAGAGRVARCARPASGSGQTPKPHLVTYRERIVVDGGPIGADDFAGCVERGARRAPTGSPAGTAPPTEFELLTAVAFAWFAEVASTSRSSRSASAAGSTPPTPGTAAWPSITNVALDHMDRLGDTIAAIAREKAAIIERGDLRGHRRDAARRWRVIRRRARAAGRAARPCASRLRSSAGTATASTVDLPRLGPTRVGLRGRHQAANVGGRRRDPRRARGGRASRPSPADARRAGTPTRAGRAGSSCSVRRATATSCSTVPTTRPARPRWPPRSTTCGRTSWRRAAVTARSSGVDGRQGRRRAWSTRWPGSARSPGRRSSARAVGRAAGDAGRRPRRRSGGRRRAAHGRSSSRTRRRALDAALGPRRPGPVVVAGSLYLVGAARAPPASTTRTLRDPDPEPEPDSVPGRPCPRRPRDHRASARRPSAGASGRS